MNSLLNSIYGNVKDTTSILTDIDIQIEATSAINKMYNYQFEEAEKEFRWLSSEYKNHPLPVFLLGLSSWWKIDAQSSKSYIGESQKENILDKNFQAKYLEIGGNQASVIAFQVYHFVIISPIKIGVFGSV